MSDFFRRILKRLAVPNKKQRYFLNPPQLIFLESRINPAPTTFTVTNLNSSGQGSLADAIDQANNASNHPENDTIVFASSLFTSGSAKISLSSPLPAIADASTAGTLTITGPGANTLNISGNNGNFSIFNISTGGNLSIAGVTVSGANFNGNGGAFSNSGTLAISSSTISGNSAVNGAGIFNNGTSLTISNSTISGNTSSSFGGGINNYKAGSTSIFNSTISNNRATNGGGGIVNTNSNLSVSNSTIYGNTTSSYGGGIFNTSVSSGQSTLSVINTTISGNSAGTNNGGGIFNNATISVLSNTIIANSLKGNDFVGNTPTTSVNNLISAGSLTGATTVTGAQINLGPLQDNGGSTFTMALGAGSVAIGATPGNGTDQRGINRTTADIGAYSFGIQVTNTSDSNNVGSGSLRAAINLANNTAGNDQISFNLIGNQPYTIILNSELPEILDATTVVTGGFIGTINIAGLGANSLKIDGNDIPYNIFNIASGGNLFISGMTLTGARKQADGGAIYNLGTLSISNSTITDNYSSSKGGGIFNDGVLYIYNTTLSNNTSGPYGGGGIYNSKSLTVINSSFSKNSTSGNSGSNYTSSGGAVFNNSTGTLTILNSTFSDNFAVDNGGGIFNSGILNFTNSTASGNLANLNGGGIHNTGTLTVNNSTLSGNTGNNNGGGISNTGALTISNSTMVANKANTKGGGIYNSGNLSITNATISGNSANSNNGGGISNYATLNLLSNTIIANSTSGGDFAGNTPVSSSNNLITIGSLTGATTVTGAQIKLGPLQDNGGPTFTMALGAGSVAIGTTAGTGTDQRGINRTTNDIGAYSFGIQVTNTSDSSTAGSGSLRAAINLANSTPGNDGISFAFTSGSSPYTISLTSSLPSIANSSTAGGLTINGLGASSLIISGNNGNFSIFNIDTGGSLFLFGSTVSGANFTSGNGGAFKNSGSLAISSSTITGNSAVNGAGIFNIGTALSVSNSTISGNTSKYFGGGINNYNGGTISISNSTISNNSTTDAGTGGGAGIINTNSSLTVNNSKFTGNSSLKDGGAVLNTNANSFLVVNNSTFSSNTARNGGAVFNKGTATFNTSTISGNINAIKGGGFYNDTNGNLTLTDSTVLNNSSTGNGGAIFNYGASLNIYKSTISGNSSSANGGGISNKNAGAVTISYTKVSSNSAASGAGVYNRNTRLSISNSTISGNSGTGYGGGLNNFNCYTNTIAISNSTISNNSALLGGGGIINTNSTLSVSNSTIYGNSTSGNGGGILNFTGSSTLSVTNSTISGNSASSANGGGISNNATITLLSNTIIANSLNGADFVGNAPITNINNLVETLGTVTGTFTPAFTSDPLLGPLQDNGGPTFTMALSAGSVAIGTTPGSGTDQRGINRTTADIGAYSFGIQVTNTSDSSTAGSGSLRAAINLANSTPGNDGISFAFSSGSSPYTISLTSSLPNIISTTTDINGSFAGNVIINGIGSSSLTISGNNGNFSIFNTNSRGNLFISGVTSSGANFTSGNGGAFNNFGTLAISSSVISGNTANNGGGISNQGTLTISNSSISGNTTSVAGSGGGIYNIGTISISNSTISSNFGNSLGGAIHNFANLFIYNSTISGNSSNNIGGIYNYSGDFLKGTVTISNSTVANNTGGGILNNGILNIANTIIANSTNGTDYSGGGTVNLIGSSTATNNLITQAGSLVSAWATTVTSAALKLGPLQNNGGLTFTMALLPNSAAIGAGNPTISNSAPINRLDQRGFVRNNSDIGAYSYNFASANDAVVSLDNSNQVVITLSSYGTTLSDVHTSYNAGANTLTITAATTGTLSTAPSTGISGISIINGSTDTITLDLNTLRNFAGIVLVGNSGLDSVTIGTGGVDLSAVATGAINQSFTANILGTSTSTSALVLTNAIKTKGAGSTYLTAGTINGAGLITTPSITLLANTGIGNTTALSLAAELISANSTEGMINLANALGTAVTVSSLTTTGNTTTNTQHSPLITFSQSLGGTVTFNNVSSAGSVDGYGVINLINNSGGITIASSGVNSEHTGSTIIITATGNIIINGPIDAGAADGRVELSSSAGSISGASLITGGEAILLAQTGIAANTYMPSGVAATSTISGDISINSNFYVKLNTISAPGNLTITSSGNINQNNPITVAGIASFNAANGIDLTNASNNFMGTVNLSNSGSNNVAITDLNAITIGTTSLGTGTLTVNAVGITQSGAITQASGAGTATFNAGAGVIT
ncbi:MAG: choice-of-anchor Q domain-containing protein, partial [Gemmataceae bacterium]